MEASRTQPRLKIIIVGAGLAGVAAAVRLSDAGHQVLLYERAPFLGGRAGSYFDKSAGRSLDVGQHVYLYCCDRYRQLLHRLGTDQLAPLQSPMNIRVIDARRYPDSRSIASLSTSALPIPMHLAPAFLRYGHLTLKERLHAARTARRMARLDHTAPDLEAITFGQWLRMQGETENAVASFWSVVVVAALNASVDEVSASWGLMLFQQALLGHRRAAEVGIPRVPLADLLSPVAGVVHANGGSLHLGTFVRSVCVEDQTACGVLLADGRRIDADAVVLAVAHKQVKGLLPAGVQALPFFSDLGQLPNRTIIDVHMGFSRPVTPPDYRFGVFLHSPVQWLFAHEGGKRLAISISNPGEYEKSRSNELGRLVVNEVQRLLNAPEPDWVVVRRHGNATFDVGPGSSRYRRPQRTPVQNLYVAGDWTQTGWPATMEGAVRGGEFAADALLRDVIPRRDPLWTSAPTNARS